MIKRMLAVAACGLFLFACGGGGGEYVKLAEEYSKKVCDAKDATEAANMQKEYAEKAAELAKKGEAADGDTAKKLGEFTQKMTKCMQDKAKAAAGG